MSTEDHDPIRLAAGPVMPPTAERLAAHEAARNALKEAIGELETAQHMRVDQAITNYRTAVLGLRGDQ